jgi:hypothetical protein
MAKCEGPYNCNYLVSEQVATDLTRLLLWIFLHTYVAIGG